LSLFDDISPFDLKSTPLYLHDNLYRSRVDRYVRAWSALDSVNSTISVIKKELTRRKHGIHIVTQGEISVMTGGTASKEDISKGQNVEQIDGESPDYTLVGSSVTRVNSEDLEIKGFFGRPVQIAALQLDLNTDIDLRLDVWDLYLENPTVRSKLRNYPFMKCDLNVRFMLSGTPFHYGRLICAYEPYPEVNQIFPGFGPTFRTEKLKYFSQAPGTLTMDVRENAPLDMHIPYVAPQPIARLFNNSALVQSSTDPFDDFHELGAVFVSTLNQIKAVTDGATEVYLYVYVYATNVVLHGTTATQMSIVTEGDERQTGPVEKFASSALKVSTALQTVPAISMYARASTYALTALKGIASLFGWSYPTMIAHPIRNRPDPYQNGAHTIGLDTGKKLTLDPKQEITIDPRALAMTEDEMCISHICSKESYLDTFTWSADSVVATDVLWSAAVTPRANIVREVGDATTVMPTALSFAATPFANWRGSITYRFDMVVSNFHRGKIMFVYEPNQRQFDLISLNTKLNKQYVKIVDLQETQTIEFVVDWNFPKPWCRNITDASMVNSVGSQFVQTSEFFDTCNGVIYVVPFTQLQSPDSSDIQVNVFVKSTDMMFNRMTDQFLPQDNNPYVVTEGDISNQPVTIMKMNEALLPNDHVSEDCFGEQPLSFRALLKRYMSGKRATWGPTTQNVRMFLPVYYGTFYGDSPVVYNLYNYLKWAYMAQRGGMRRRFYFPHYAGNDIDTATPFFPSNRVVVSLSNNSTTTIPVSATASGFETNLDMDGSVTFLSTVNEGYEVEIPYYSNNLFAWAFNDDPYYNVSATDPDNNRNITVILQKPYNARGYFSEAIAAADDFSFIRWVGAYPYTLRL